MGAVTQAMRRSAEAAGVEIHTDAEVARILVEDGIARGIELKNGKQVRAGRVIANANAQTTFLRLIEQNILSPISFPRSSVSGPSHPASRSTWRPTSCHAGPPMTPAACRMRIRARSRSRRNLEELEDAFESARHGSMAPRPYLWILTPSAFDPTVAPPASMS
jgi:phytoene dehydrogenase-like protein